MLEPICDSLLHSILVLPKRVEILLEGSELFLKLLKLASVVDGGQDLLLVPHNTRISHQPLRVLVSKRRNLRYRETCKGLLELWPLVLDNLPVQTRCEDSLGHAFKILVIVFRRLHIPARRHESWEGWSRF